ncbi:5-hydroxyisourate hydrolase [Eurosta solidaginis]|uniref:5-hydroxyisourate hydrolase n=1 Tax=Eurosta solidaginis TaxID=178769 RepID=UPI003530CAA3
MQINSSLVLLLSIFPMGLHITMSSTCNRVRLRVETKEGLESVSTNNASSDIRTISAHILDTTIGQAVSNVNITIYRLTGDNVWQKLNEVATNEDGRVNQLVNGAQYKGGIYKLHFNVEPYFTKREVKTFYPFIEIVVRCEQSQHYHIPLLLNPFGYTTYRGT